MNIKQVFNGLVIVWVLYSALQGWVHGSGPSRAPPRGQAGEAAPLLLRQKWTEPWIWEWAFWYSPDIFSVLQSRGSGRIGSGGKELWGESDKQLSLGPMSSEMETLTHQPEGFGAWPVDSRRPPRRVWSHLIVWPIRTPTCWPWLCSASFIRSVSKSIFSSSVLGRLEAVWLSVRKHLFLVGPCLKGIGAWLSIADLGVGTSY